MIINYFNNPLKHFVVWFKTIGGIYIVWIGIHYFASHFYVEFCVPKTLWGFLISPFLASTTHCSALRWCIQNGANEIQSMWLLLGTWFSLRLLFYSKEEKKNGEEESNPSLIT